MSMRRWIGISGLGFVVIELIGFGLFFAAGPPTGLDPADKLVAYYQAHGRLLTTVVLVYDLSFIPLLVFIALVLSGLRPKGFKGRYWDDFRTAIQIRS